ncbi:hypothetical protein KUTeg_000919 [Tegillarca granosa]|uniref:Amine oxidase n=1 Tax=Tegillarca granosa TaxID=220873 RepID=A0ABQ9FWA5_TEGGR|nr:hypothetical protein KUTeg_000919 [Tegillarca granosa]
MEADTPKYRRSIGRWRLLSFILLLLCLGLIIAVIVVWFAKDKILEEKRPPTCSNEEGIIDLSEPDNPSVFHDLTTKEVKGLNKYLYSQKSLNLVDPSKTTVNSSYVFMVELQLPKKADALNHLQNNRPQPAREAVVTIFCGDLPKPVVKEYIVGPLPNPVKHTLKRTIPFNYRPMNIPEYAEVLALITQQANNIAGEALLESYGAKLVDCDDKCLVFKYITIMSSPVTGEDARKIWFWLSHFVEYYVLHPLDFALLVRLDGRKYTIDRVWYNGRDFTSLQKFAEFYDNNKVQLRKEKIDFPNAEQQMFAKLSLREPSFPKTFKRNPVQIEPDGKRYSIKGRHVKYMNWDFDFRMSSAHGPQLYDIRYQNERIVYEIGLQELSVFYSGHNPAKKFANFFDTFGLLGPQAKALVPGVDCPEHATFISASHYLETSKEPVVFKNAFCLFEHNKEMPLRRHHSYSSFQGSFYEGMESVVLILRTLITVINYDYIFDFIFYQNGVIEVKGVSTGYILATAFSPSERPYGFQLHDHINGNIHLHLFSFKVDLDVKGTVNRYQTLDISATDVPNIYSTDKNARYHQTKFVENLRTSELNATYKFDFDHPKYLLFYNERERNKYGNPRAYRVLMKGMAKQLVPEGFGNEPAASWARYQLAVTKHKDEEEHSSSLYAIFDSEHPVVQFQKFIDDNDAIVDQDLVAWITMGVHHIPHTEDLPVTHSAGMELNFYLSPYNYFKEDPAMAARNAMRIEPKDKNDPKKGLKIMRYDDPKKLQCLPPDNKYDEEVKEDPGVVLESGESGGTAI